MTSRVDKGLVKLVRALYPSTCVLCGASGEKDRDLCADCRAGLPHNPHACRLCAIPLPPAAPLGTVCGDCNRKPPPFDLGFAPFLYRDAMPFLLTGLKFHARMNHARLLGDLLFDALRSSAVELPQALLPVPLHAARMRRRGFNQALEIARRTADGFGLPLELDLSRRIKATSAHSGLDAKARRKDIRGAFELTTEPAYSHLALIDDVVTTGATVTELARLLKRAGVARVDVWAVARTPARM